MSTKIWNAVRVPVGRYHEFLAWLEKKTLPATRKVFRVAIDTVNIDKVLSDPTVAAELRLTKKPVYGLYDRFEVAAYAMKAVHLSSSPFTHGDPNLSVQAWFDSRHAHLILFGQHIPARSLPDYAEDFHYQNQTDAPNWARDYKYDEDPKSKTYGEMVKEGPGHRRWRLRGEKWDRLLDRHGPLTVAHVWDWTRPRIGFEMALRVFADRERRALMKKYPEPPIVAPKGPETHTPSKEWRKEAST